MPIKENMCAKSPRGFRMSLAGLAVAGVAVGLAGPPIVSGMYFLATGRVHVHFDVDDGQIVRETVRVGHIFTRSVLEKDAFIARYGQGVYDMIYSGRKLVFISPLPDDPDPICYYSSGGYEWTETVPRLPCPP